MHEEFTVGTFILALLNFVKIVFGSFLVAAVVGGIATLVRVCWVQNRRNSDNHNYVQLYKHSNLREYPPVESALLIMYAYVSYLLAENLHLSGIVSILFCGIIMSHYAYLNLSEYGLMLLHRRCYN